MAKKTKKKVSRSRAPKKAASAKPVVGLTTSELRAEIARRQRGLNALTRKRDKLIAQLANIDAQIRDLGGSSGGTRKRPKNEMNLVEALQKLLKNKQMSVTEAAQSVQDAGYQTTAANFRTIVNQTLIREKVFKKVARGIYTAA